LIEARVVDTPEYPDMKGKVALVTGGSSGIGLATLPRARLRAKVRWSLLPAEEKQPQKQHSRSSQKRETHNGFRSMLQTGSRWLG